MLRVVPSALNRVRSACVAWTSGYAGPVPKLANGAVVVGEPYQKEFALYHVRNGVKVSPWHAIPLQASPGVLFNYVNEISKGTSGKMEINTKQPLNPIMQDVKNGALRFMKFQKGVLPWNYGCLPQTWEDPSQLTHGYRGDNDPLDALELSPEPLALGDVRPVRVLGALGLIDEGECDWKLITLCERRAQASGMRTLADVSPHLLDDIRHWYRHYKTSEGKAENGFLFDGAFKDGDYAQQVVWETHEHWQRLRAGRAASDGLYIADA